MKKRTRSRPAKTAGPHCAKLEAELHRLRKELATTATDPELDALRKAQRELEESRHNYADLYDFAPCGYLSLDRNGCICAANLTAAHLFGLRRVDLVGRPLLPLIAKADRRKYLTHLSRLRRGQAHLTTKVVIAVKNRPPVPVQLISAAGTGHGTGHPFLTALVDLTESQRAEEQVRRLAQFPEENPNAVMRVGSDGALLYANASAREFLATLGWQNDGPLPATVLAPVTNARGENRTVEQEITVANGRTVWFTAVPVALEQYVNLYGRDTTERRQAEEALRTSEERLAEIVGSAMDAIISVDGQQRITLFNAAAERMFDMTADAMLGRPLAELIPERFRRAHEQHVGQFGQTGVTSRRMGALGEIHGRRADGTEFPIEASISQVEVAGGKVFTVILRDITERKQAEAALQREREQLEVQVQQRTADLSAANRALQAEIARRQQAEAARLALLRRLAEAEETERGRLSRELHDRFGQELTAMKLALQLVGKHSGSSRVVQRCVRQLQDLTDGLLRNMHRLAWELHPAVLDDFGLDAALRRYVNEWSEQTGLQVDLHSQGLEARRLPAEIETTLYRVAQEALLNVFRHAQARRVSVLLERRPDHASLIVEDDGRGFDAAALLAPGAPETLGVLGMRERVTLAGGTLDIESTPGAGTTLFVRIPLVQTRRES